MAAISTMSFSASIADKIEAGFKQHNSERGLLGTVANNLKQKLSFNDEMTIKEAIPVIWRDRDGAYANGKMVYHNMVVSGVCNVMRAYFYPQSIFPRFNPENANHPFYTGKYVPLSTSTLSAHSVKGLNPHSLLALIVFLAREARWTDISLQELLNQFLVDDNGQMWRDNDFKLGTSRFDENCRRQSALTKKLFSEPIIRDLDLFELVSFTVPNVDPATGLVIGFSEQQEEIWMCKITHDIMTKFINEFLNIGGTIGRPELETFMAYIIGNDWTEAEE